MKSKLVLYLHMNNGSNFLIQTNFNFMAKTRIRIPEDHPELIKYLDKDGVYNPYLSEIIRDTYKEDRVKIHNQFNKGVSKLFDKIFNKK